VVRRTLLRPRAVALNVVVVKAGTGFDSAQGLAERVEELMRQAKLDRKEALKLAAKERGMTRREAYERVLEEKGEADQAEE